MTAPNPKKPRVAALVATYRRDTELARLLGALQAAALPPTKVFVADNAASGETRDLCGRGGAEWIPVPINRGPGPAWNAALEAALADPGFTHFLVLDDDVVPPPEALAVLVDTMESAGACAVAPLLYDEKGMLWGFPEPCEVPLRAAIRKVTDTASASAALGGDPHPFCWATGACMLYRRDVFEKCGKFREDFWMLGEDLEFSMRAAAAGGGVFTARVAVPHLPPAPGDPRAAALAHRAKFLALLQNLSFLAFHSPHSAHLRSYLPGNFRRYLRTEGISPATLREVVATFWHGAVRGQPAGTPAGARIREAAQKRLSSDRL